MKDLNKTLIELKDMLSDAMITQIDLDLKIKLVCKLNEALSIANVVGRSEQLCECKCEYPIIRTGVTEYCSICQLEVK